VVFADGAVATVVVGDFVWERRGVLIATEKASAKSVIDRTTMGVVISASVSVFNQFDLAEARRALLIAWSDRTLVGIGAMLYDELLQLPAIDT
jgi:hypothetical protein